MHFIQTYSFSGKLSAKGEATSRDGSVRVTVDATGVVTALEFAPSTFGKYTPDRLAAATVAKWEGRSSPAEAAAEPILGVEP